MNQRKRVCYKMDRPCNRGCEAFRKNYPTEALGSENLSGKGSPLILDSQLEKFTMGETNCLELFLFCRKISLMQEKRQRR